MTEEQRSAELIEIKEQLKKLDDTEIANVLRLILREQSELRAEFHQFRGEICDISAKAFPDGDLEVHKNYHQQVIEWQRTRRRLVNAALEKAAAAGGLAGTAWVMYALWQAFKTSVNGG